MLIAIIISDCDFFTNYREENLIFHAIIAHLGREHGTTYFVEGANLTGNGNAYQLLTICCESLN